MMPERSPPLVSPLNAPVGNDARHRKLRMLKHYVFSLVVTFMIGENKEEIKMFGYRLNV